MFLMAWLNGRLSFKLTKDRQKHSKTLISITLNTSQLKNDYYENIYSENPLYLIIGEIDGFIEENMEISI